ncbi:MAG TPA: carboxypeptidase-like regulatory domain-containing protein [Bryobacteraceae bacterium]|nr:carboxypeptidase-like regulatory domain-containing protein [Bryobacteraceae bacterium]
MKRKKKRNISLVLLLALALPLVAAGKKKAMPEAYGLVSVSVFHEPGLSLPEADVTLIPAPAAGELPVKVKKMQAVTDSRGEYVFRVPAATMTYTVKVTAKGYHGEEKSVTVHGEERADVTFTLHEESKK